MQKFLHWSSRILAIIFSIPFVILLPASLILVNAESRLFAAETYKRALEKTNMYERMPTLMAEQILLSLNANPCEKNPVLCSTLDMKETALDVCLRDSLGPDTIERIANDDHRPNQDEQDKINECINTHGIPNLDGVKSPPSYFKYLTVKDWEMILRSLFPPEQIQTFTETSLAQAFGYLNGNSSRAFISLIPLKERLHEKGVEALQQLIKAQPSCTRPEQVNEMQEWFTNGTESDFALCNPSLVGMARLTPAIKAGLATEIETLPDEIELFSNADPQLQLGLANGRTLLRLSLLLPLFFLTLVTLFSVRNLKGWLRWWGIPLALAGGLGLVISLFLGPIGQFMMREIFISTPQSYDTNLAFALTELWGTILAELTRPLGIQSVLLGLLGGGLWIGSFFAHKIDEQSDL